MISLGINIGHDRGAAIVKDGVLIGAIAQERVDRKKHSPSFLVPFMAIDHLLKYLDIDFEEIDIVGISSTAIDANNLVELYKKELQAYYKTNNFEMIPVTHHQSHAFATYFTSNFEEAVILVADGGGEIVGNLEESESIFEFKNNVMVCKEQRLQSQFVHALSRPQNFLYPFMNNSFFDEKISIGKKYEQITRLIGFGWGEEGKTMGLASYGKYKYRKTCNTLNSIDFNLNFVDIIDLIEKDYQSSGKRFFQFITDNRADIANSIQRYAEEQVLAIIKYVINKYKTKNICLSGGLFLNCPINHKILESFDGVKIHICPASGDDGQAIGNAFAAYSEIGDIKNTSKVLPYLGIEYSDNEILNAIKKKGQSYKYFNNEELAKYVAQSIHSNKIVGFFHGRSEIGPRALCHRSILANPCWDGMKDYLNEQVKHREPFRPFAPVVVSDNQFEIFELKQESPYMLLAAPVKENFKWRIPSVTHVDGSARVQSVSQEKDPLVFNILKEFEKISGVPVILNTSFNDNGEPIVESPEDAINTFLNTNIDILILENFVVEKANHTPKGM